MQKYQFRMAVIADSIRNPWPHIVQIATPSPLTP
jgi:hypothetical protein